MAISTAWLIETMPSFFGLGAGLGGGVLEQRVDLLRDGRRARRVLDAHDVDADLVGHGRAGAFAHALGQQRPVHQHQGLVGALVFGGVDAADVEVPVARVDGAAQGDGVADFPAKALGQLAAHDGALTVPQEGGSFFVAETVLRVKREVARAVDREAGEEVLLVDVDAAKPVGPGDLAHAVDLADALGVVQRQGVAQRDRTARDQARVGGGVDTRIPGVDDGAQQPE